MRKRTIVVSLAVLAAAALAGGAYAATRSSSKARQVPIRVAAPLGFAGPLGVAEQNVLGDAARRLGVSSTRLTGALKQAVIDQINAALKAKRLPAPLAKALKQRLESNPGLPLGPGLLAFGAPVPAQVQAFGPRAFKGGPPPFGPGGAAVPGGFIGPPGLFGPSAALPAAAKYLGLSASQVTQQLRSGKSLAGIAQAQGKSTAGLEQAIVSGVKSQLAKAAAAGKAAEQAFVAKLQKLVQATVNQKGFIGPAQLKGNAHVQFKAAPVAAPLAFLLGLVPRPLVRAYIGPPPR